jgi:hypothetical protein
MTYYTIKDFWKVRLPVSRQASRSFIPGWSVISDGLASFEEAPLTLSAELSSDGDPLTSSILLISAPGAVGKSTLAKQIAFETGAIYVDLVEADPVGGNSVSGGLLKSELYSQWQANTTTLLIDGLDEARLRVTQEAFESFLTDIAQLSNKRPLPTVLFGRTGAIQDAWLFLSDGLGKSEVLEIGYYNTETALNFADARIRALRPESPHASVERTAAKLLLEKLRSQTTVDGDRFAGYAPVLQAVAARVAAEENASALVAKIEKGAQPVTLHGVVNSILERERSKLEGLKFEDEKIKQILYRPEEQLDRLVARVYGLAPPDMPRMRPADVQTYSTVLDTWVGEHPFLNGGREASSAVFDAIITVQALKAAASAEVAVERELRKGAAANPFVSEFYAPENSAREDLHIPSEHIGIVYASFRARLSLGDSANLVVEGSDAEEEEALRAEVEITLARRDSDRPRVLQFTTEQTGVLRLGAYIEDIDLSVPYSKVEMGPGPETLLVAPVSIQCDALIISSDKIIVESPATAQGDTPVFLEANTLDGARIVSIPIVRGNSSLAVAWPGARNHPWTSFATEPAPVDDPRLDEALRRFRKIVIAFRSHSKGNLARYQHKIEHARMTKGAGQAVLNHLIDEHILSLKAPMYFLDPVRLGEAAGATYADCMARRFQPKTIEFVRKAIESEA